MELNKKSFKDVWDRLDEIQSAVVEMVQKPESDECRLRDLTVNIRKEHKHAISIFRSFTQELLEVATATPVGTSITSADQCFDEYLTWFYCNRNTRGGGHEPSPRPLSRMETRMDEWLMEQLTAMWLGLYFLSEPMGHPWEQVRRIAEEQGGYPIGACVTKLIGDVYREARIEQNACGLHAEVFAKGGDLVKDVVPVLVLSAHPSALMKELLIRDDEGKLTPHSLHVLGRCYSLFQLRLYVSDGRPINYIVTPQVLSRSWLLARRKMSVQDARLEIWDKAAVTHMVDWLNTVFPRDTRKFQRVVLHTSLENFEVAPCVLGRQIGIYALEPGADGTRFIGNGINNKLLESLRYRVMNHLDESRDDVFELFKKSDVDFANELNRLLNPAAAKPSS